jgi:hypothetical protein
MELTLEKAIRQRDLYRQLLEVGLDDDLELFLDRALTLFIEVTGARRGYIERSTIVGRATALLDATRSRERHARAGWLLALCH